MFGNKLSGAIDVELGQLKNLRELVLSYNQFEGNLPQSTASLAKLEFVQLQGNNFRSIRSLQNLSAEGLATFDSDDEFLNIQFAKESLSRTRMATNKSLRSYRSKTALIKMSWQPLPIEISLPLQG